MVEQAHADGKRPIIVTSLIGARTIQKKLRKDLAGLDYEFNAKGLVQHDLFVTWIGETVREELARRNGRPRLSVDAHAALKRHISPAGAASSCGSIPDAGTIPGSGSRLR